MRVIRGDHNMSDPPPQPAIKGELQRAVRSRNEFLVQAGREAYVISAEARSDRSVYVREVG
jgi:hypothetical protein